MFLHTACKALPDVTDCHVMTGISNNQLVMGISTNVPPIRAGGALCHRAISDPSAQVLHAPFLLASESLSHQATVTIYPPTSVCSPHRTLPVMFSQASLAGLCSLSPKGIASETALIIQSVQSSPHSVLSIHSTVHVCDPCGIMSESGSVCGRTGEQAKFPVAAEQAVPGRMYGGYSLATSHMDDVSGMCQSFSAVTDNHRQLHTDSLLPAVDKPDGLVENGTSRKLSQDYFHGVHCGLYHRSNELITSIQS